MQSRYAVLISASCLQVELVLRITTARLERTQSRPADSLHASMSDKGLHDVPLVQHACCRSPQSGGLLPPSLTFLPASVTFLTSSLVVLDACRRIFVLTHLHCTKASMSARDAMLHSMWTGVAHCEAAAFCSSSHPLMCFRFRLKVAAPVRTSPFIR